MASAAYLLLHLFLRLSAKSCWHCLQEDGQFCLETNKCVEKGETSTCKGLVKVPINCPFLPAPQYVYDDGFVRNTVFPIIAAAQSSGNPQDCFNNQVPTMIYNRFRYSNCSSLFPDVTCAGFTALDHSKKVIALSIRGSHGSHQYLDLYKIGNKNGTVPFFNVGRITKVFSDNFWSLWNSGLGDDLQTLIELYPNYELWITGYSMGASLALISSAYMALSGMASPYNMKVVLLGCPRATDYDFAMWHSMNFPYSYHIVHAHDYVPRVPFYDNIDKLALYHPRTEVWYDNDMRHGDDYRICEQADIPFCSSQVFNLSTPDHAHYFNVDVTKWAGDGCPKNREDYRPIPGTHQRVDLPPLD